MTSLTLLSFQKTIKKANDFSYFWGINSDNPEEVLERKTKIKAMIENYGGVIDVISNVARTALHEMTHTVVGGRHADEGADRYPDGQGSGPGIMNSGNYPRSPFPRDIMQESMKFHKPDKDKLWEFFNTRGSERGPDGKFRWKQAPPPKDNLSNKLKN